MPPLHSPSVPTSVPSTSISARAKNSAGWPLQRTPGTGWQILSQGLQIRQGLVAEEEADARVVVPAVQVLRLRELGIAAEQDLAKAATEASS